jgi:hypothetical protein
MGKRMSTTDPALLIQLKVKNSGALESLTMVDGKRTTKTAPRANLRLDPCRERGGKFVARPVGAQCLQAMLIVCGNSMSGWLYGSNLRFYLMILTTIFVLCMMAPAFSDSPSAERAWYEDLEAFQTTNSSQGPQCQHMVFAVNQLSAYPGVNAQGQIIKVNVLSGPLSHAQRLSFQGSINALADESSMCLYGVRRETHDKLPAIVPFRIHTLTCKLALSYPQPDAGVVQICSLKYEKFIEGL